MKEELPETKQGLLTYLAYAEKQIKENELANNRLRKWIGICHDRLEKYKGDGK
jgi:hypothetical protein